MTNAQLLALIVRDGINVAFKIAEILRNPEEEVSEATISRLRMMASRTAADYEKPVEATNVKQRARK